MLYACVVYLMLNRFDGCTSIYYVIIGNILVYLLCTGHVCNTNAAKVA